MSRPKLTEAPLTAVIGLAVLTFVASLLVLGAKVDRLELQREQALAANALHGAMREVADQATANTDWDDAVDRASNHFDADWVRDNIGAYYTQPRRFQFVYLLDAGDRPIYAMASGRAADPGQFTALRPLAAPLIAAVRAKEARRGAFPRAPSAGRVIAQPIQADDVVEVDRNLFILTATLIQPEFGTHLPDGPRSAIIVTGKPIDGAFLDTLGRRLLLSGFRLASVDAQAKASIMLTSRSGQALGRIAWIPLRPGANLIASIAVPSLIGVGAPLLFYLVARRRTQRLREALAEVAEAHEAAQAANEQKSAFLAMMSHEIRTPLNGVLAMAQLMQVAPLSPMQRERLAVIRQSGESLLTIVNDVLDLSKIEAGYIELDVRPFEMAELAGALKSLYQPVAEEKGLAYTVKLEAATKGCWRGDPDRLRQVAANLISNAMKFTAQGEVHVQVSEAEPGLVRFAVRDTGIGVPADKLDLIFDPFRQAESSTARRYGGTGLGLAISRQLVTLMNGRLWVESSDGEGSLFAFEVPLERCPNTAPERTGTPTETLGPAQAPRILAADDNPTNRLILQQILEPLGAHLHLCEDGAGALDAWRRGPFDLILMDIQMPVLDGVAAAERIRTEERDQGRPRTPIIALTANAMPHQLQHYLSAGMDGCVAKPIRIAELVAAIDRALAPQQPVMSGIS